MLLIAGLTVMRSLHEKKDGQRPGEVVEELQYMICVLPHSQAIVIYYALGGPTYVNILPNG